MACDVQKTWNIFISQIYDRTVSSNGADSELISFYGSFLSFVGAFCLGYFIYKRNEKNRKM